ncbi:MAG TPA: hypothetical protein VMY35_02705 [Phycisphaerae bacterium]|nr:hypothetical protein [Phycisphaerae bacterium]
MPEIYLRHPDHGVKIASLEQEAEYDEQNGWNRYTPGEEAEDEPAPPVNVLARRRRREVHDGYSG